MGTIVLTYKLHKETQLPSWKDEDQFQLLRKLLLFREPKPITMGKENKTPTAAAKNKSKAKSNALGKKKDLAESGDSDMSDIKRKAEQTFEDDSGSESNPKKRLKPLSDAKENIPSTKAETKKDAPADDSDKPKPKSNAFSMMMQGAKKRTLSLC